MSPVTQAFYARFIGAPTAWLRSADGRRLLAKAIWHLRQRVGRKEARQFWQAITLAHAITEPPQ